jgi:hypothetical protein
MKRTPLRRRAKLRAGKQLQRRASLQRTAAMAASESQRAAVAGHTCVVCGPDRRIDPAHLLSERQRAVARDSRACSVVDMSARPIAVGAGCRLSHHWWWSSRGLRAPTSHFEVKPPEDRPPSCAEEAPECWVQPGAAATVLSARTTNRLVDTLTVSWR